jgi:Spy/CpxP family protein refolding chaperone
MKARLTTVMLMCATAAAGQLLPGWVIGSWWKHQDVIERLGLTPEQQKKIDDVFQQFRVRLIDHTAAVDREEAIMEQLMTAEPVDPVKVRPQIDRVADARAQLEKTNANMLLEMRLVLTKEQWEALKSRAGRGSIVPQPAPVGPRPKKR